MLVRYKFAEEINVEVSMLNIMQYKKLINSLDGLFIEKSESIVFLEKEKQSINFKFVSSTQICKSISKKM